MIEFLDGLIRKVKGPSALPPQRVTEADSGERGGSFEETANLVWLKIDRGLGTFDLALTSGMGLKRSLKDQAVAYIRHSRSKGSINGLEPEEVKSHFETKLLGSQRLKLNGGEVTVKLERPGSHTLTYSIGFPTSPPIEGAEDNLAIRVSSGAGETRIMKSFQIVSMKPGVRHVEYRLDWREGRINHFQEVRLLAREPFGGAITPLEMEVGDNYYQTTLWAGYGDLTPDGGVQLVRFSVADPGTGEMRQARYSSLEGISWADAKAGRTPNVQVNETQGTLIYFRKGKSLVTVPLAANVMDFIPSDSSSPAGTNHFIE